MAGLACRKCACGVCAALCSPRPKRTGRAHCSPGASPFSLSQRLRYRSLVSSLGASSPVFARSCIQRKGARSSSACLSLLLLVTSTPSPPPRCTPWLLHHPTQREACRRISSCSWRETMRSMISPSPRTSRMRPVSGSKTSRTAASTARRRKARTYNIRMSTHQRSVTAATVELVLACDAACCAACASGRSGAIASRRTSDPNPHQGAICERQP